VRIAIVSESFPPDVNGVAHSTLRMAEHLAATGHEPLVIAPQPATNAPGSTGPFPCPVVRVASVPVPGYSGFRVGLSGRTVRAALAGHRAEIVHLASPFVLGARGAAAARRLGLPVLAVYQTDVPAYARVYGLGKMGEAIAWWWVRHIHNAATANLTPSTATAATLREHGVRQVGVWGRGVDTVRFDPARRSEALRKTLAPHGELLVGYVGRLAAEKRIDLLRPIIDLAGVRLVIVGGGPSADELRRAMPGADFLGPRYGTELAEIYASLDVFVHAGACDTFGQTLQEAAASGLPVIAPAAGGPLDLIEEGRTGYLVTPDDAGAITTAVVRLAADDALRAAMGAAGRKMVLGRTWAACGDVLIGHYHAVLAQAGGAGRRPDQVGGGREVAPAGAGRDMARGNAVLTPAHGEGGEAARERWAGVLG
jgi:phosphatidylinositol alpha 1,6-mannosyltransferase